MKFKLLVSTLIAVFCISGTVMVAQDSPMSDPMHPGYTKTNILFGICAGYNRVSHSTNLATFNDATAPCPVFKNANNNGVFFGAFYEQLLGGKTTQHSLVLKVLYNTMPASFSVAGDNLPSLVSTVGTDNKPVSSTTRFDNDVKYNLLSGELMYKFKALEFPLGKFNTALVLTGGPTVDIPIKKTHDQTLKLVDANQSIRFKQVPGYQYSPDLRTIYLSSGDIPNANSTRFGLKFGAQYEIITGGPIDFIPGIFYNYALTDVSKDEDWKVNALQIGLDIRFSVSF